MFSGLPIDILNLILTHVLLKTRNFPKQVKNLHLTNKKTRSALENIPGIFRYQLRLPIFRINIQKERCLGLPYDKRLNLLFRIWTQHPGTFSHDFGKCIGGKLFHSLTNYYEQVGEIAIQKNNVKQFLFVVLDRFKKDFENVFDGNNVQFVRQFEELDREKYIYVNDMKLDTKNVSLCLVNE